MKPNTTFTVFIHPPDFGACFSNEGKRAKSVNGMAKAMAKPNMPMVGATMSPCVETATSRKPTMGPVHEKDTKARVKAMKKMDSRPVVFSDFSSILFDQEDGSVSSNAPKNEAAKTMSSRAKIMLKMALVLSAFSAEAPKSSVTSRPSST